MRDRTELLNYLLTIYQDEYGGRYTVNYQGQKWDLLAPVTFDRQYSPNHEGRATIPGCVDAYVGIHLRLRPPAPEPRRPRRRWSKDMGLRKPK